MNKNLGILDSEKIQILQKKEHEQAERQRLLNWITEQQEHEIYVNGDESVANADFQMGSPLTSSDFEEKLKRIPGKWLPMFNPFQLGKKALYYVLPDGKLDYICAYENGIMPEFSIHRVKEEVIPSNDFSRHWDTKDFPKGRWTGWDRGWEWDENVVRPGFMKLRRPYGEDKRGWRTILIKIVLKGYATPTQVERVFGIANRAGWSNYLGKQRLNIPF